MSFAAPNSGSRFIAGFPHWSCPVGFALLGSDRSYSYVELSPDAVSSQSEGVPVAELGPTWIRAAKNATGRFLHKVTLLSCLDGMREERLDFRAPRSAEIVALAKDVLDELEASGICLPNLVSPLKLESPDGVCFEWDEDGNAEDVGAVLLELEAKDGRLSWTVDLVNDQPAGTPEIATPEQVVRDFEGKVADRKLILSSRTAAQLEAHSSLGPVPDL